MPQSVIDHTAANDLIRITPIPSYFKLIEEFVFSKSIYCPFPWGISTDSSGNIYACSYMTCYLKKYDPDGVLIASWGGQGNKPGQLLIPRGVAVDSSGNVYVSDGCHSKTSFNDTLYEAFDRVQKFSPSGILLSSIGGSLGTGNGKFGCSMGIACDADDNVYVADFDNKCIQKFNSNLKFLTSWGNGSSGNGQLNGPFDIACDLNNYVYVADKLNHCVQKFTTNGDWLGSWGSFGTGNGQFNQPSSITVDFSGHVSVVDAGNNRIQHFDSNGKWIMSWDSEGGSGITADFHRRQIIYVSDLGNHRIERFNRRQRFIFVGVRP